jgi:hypothetical protein
MAMDCLRLLPASSRIRHHARGHDEASNLPAFGSVASAEAFHRFAVQNLDSGRAGAKDVPDSH